MKKNLILIALMLLTCIGTFAQSSLIATLSHDGQIKAYYGIDAFKEAHAAAATGDVITLTGGTFNATKISKAITLRGAGMLADLNVNTYPTIISGDIIFNVTDQEHRLTIEGVKFLNNVDIQGKLNRPYFQKCIFNRISQGMYNGNYGNSNLSFATFLNCYVNGWSHATLTAFNNNSTFINSCVWLPSYDSYGIYNSIVFTNCIIRFSSNVEYLRNSTVTNSIFVSTSTSNVGVINSNNVLYGCLATGSNIQNDFFKYQVAGNNKVVTDITKVFQEFTGNNYRDDISFALTEEAAKTYLGTDSTQVGMFGGPLPFDPSISTLKITKCNVASKSTVDGKLSVDIEVSGVE